MAEENQDHYKYMPKAPGEDVRPQETAEPADRPESVTDEPSPIPFGTGENAPISFEGQPEPYEQIASELPLKEEEEPVDSEPRNPLVSGLYALLSPLLVPTYVALFIFLLSILAIVVPGAALPYTLTVFGATCIAPMIAIFILMRIGAIKTLDMQDPKERLVPYIVEILGLGAVAMFFIFKGANPWIWTIYCGGAAVAFVNYLINYRMRVSTHCSAMAAMVAALMVINHYGMPQHSLFWWLVGSVFFAGVVGTIAMTYGRHSFWEVITGYATGFIGIILFSLIH